MRSGGTRASRALVCPFRFEVVRMSAVLEMSQGVKTAGLCTIQDAFHPPLKRKARYTVNKYSFLDDSLQSAC